jgi:hypothetical protein
VSPTTPAASTQPAASPSFCARDDVAVTSGGWGGAAGSRGSDVTVENIGADSCVLGPGPQLAAFDPAGIAVIQTPTSTGGAPLTLEPGDAATFSFLFSNWCDRSVALPLAVSVVLGGEAVVIPDLGVATLDDLPACNGPEQPPGLTVTSWQPG